MLAKAKTFFEDVQAELAKVTWPTRKETISTAQVVVVIIVIISLYLGACDAVLTKLIRSILR
ncbi:preprotein translocase, SecE subunit [Citrifermentans bemidjiense Bem]|uniref:Protein translocase subunit SecE n=1 Tax=Citrifermentans bemidjiense (strain ATCC BAA-1014 / DSM 16622 / JCM 12645 / Bem) TaxID=404380 RepID=B5EFN7_CITBB|nr:preprotein translocase subunit SecE [Citrifermentans bemidjiense]ACH37941.1 preprotein translocase, SecE subunit [Citrifermentans bemidjiense Bem]